MATPTTHVHLELPADLIPILDQLGAGRTVDDHVRISLAIGLYTSHSVSLARAAEISHQSLADFIHILQQRQISWTQYDDEALAHDMAFVAEHSRDNDDDVPRR